MERQYLIFIVAAAAAFGALIIVGLYFNPLLTGDSGDGNSDPNLIRARVGQEVYVRYSYNVVKMIQSLPANNNLELRAASELHNVNLGGLRGELRYADTMIEYVQNGEEERVSGADFKSIEFKFLPDSGNQTTYTYEDVTFNARATDSQLVATFVPLSTAKVGEKYPVKLVLDAGLINYGIEDRVIEIIG
ncbi:MAG TPA: hypothetical protein VIE86_04755 [Nitrososphaera sp.]